MTARRRTRRAPNPDAATWTAADRAAIQQGRFNAQSRRYHDDLRAIDSGAAAKPAKETK